MNTPQMLPDTVSHTPDNAELMALPIPLMRSDIQSNNHAFLLSKNVGEARAPPVCTVLFTFREFSKCRADRSERRPGWREELPELIVIGNPLMISQDFPPLHTVHESFPSYGVPSSTEIKVIYTISKTDLFKCFPIL